MIGVCSRTSRPPLLSTRMQYWSASGYDHDCRLRSSPSEPQGPSRSSRAADCSNALKFGWRCSCAAAALILCSRSFTPASRRRCLFRSIDSMKVRSTAFNLLPQIRSAASQMIVTRFVAVNEFHVRIRRAKAHIRFKVIYARAVRFIPPIWRYARVKPFSISTSHL